jgi:phosphatidylglycerophosphatase A
MGAEVSSPAPALKIFHRLAILLGTIFYTGYIPFAPATFSSLVAVPFILLLASKPLIYLIVTVFLFFLGIRLARELEGIFGPDAKKITIDELSGMFVAFLFIPVSIKSLVIGFALFRLLDILKPPPLRWVERLPKGLGVMADDLLAGLATNLGLRLILII